MTTTNTILPIKQPIPFPQINVAAEERYYTQASRFIDVTPQIEAQAQEILRNEQDYYKAVFKLADWTQQNIDYNLTTLTADVVQKSSWVLRERKGVCDEITNLFISMLRSVNIPAKFVSGMVYSNVGYTFGPHGWAEVYFPGVGWVPFDVTFAQYGWIDPSHIKLNENLDSGSASAEYAWRSNNVQINVEDLELDTTVLQTGNFMEPMIKLTIAPVHNIVKAGSYVPLEVTIENLHDYYVPASIIIRKAPGLTTDNKRGILLLPREIKTIYWILEIPDDAESGYTYTAQLAAEGLFGATSTSAIKYSLNSDYPYISLERAQALIERNTVRETKATFTNLETDCVPMQDAYYSKDTAIIQCRLFNKGTTNLQNIKLCAKTTCQTLDVPASGIATTELDIISPNDGRLVVTIENDQNVLYAYTELNVIKEPELYITDVTPTVVDFKDDNIKLSFKLQSKEPIEDLFLDFDFDTISLQEFQGERDVIIDTPGRGLIKGIQFDISYKDQKGKAYEKKEAIHITVENIPWYYKMVAWIYELF